MAKKKMYVPSTRAGAAIFSLSTELKQAKQQFEAGYPIGVVDALFLCLDAGQHPPDWVEDHFEAGLSEVLRLGPSKKMGSKAPPAQQLRTDLSHFHRYDAMTIATAEGKKGEKRLEYAKSLLKDTTSDRALPTIKNSYLLVKKVLQEPNGVARFRYPRSPFVVELVLRRGKAYASTKG